MFCSYTFMASCNRREVCVAARSSHVDVVLAYCIRDIWGMFTSQMPIGSMKMYSFSMYSMRCVYLCIRPVLL